MATGQNELQNELLQWLGGVRVGTVDRSTQQAVLQPADATHPVDRGVSAFVYRDEFYPSFRFAAGAVPLLTAALDVQFRAGTVVADAGPERSTVAWAWQRDDGGRAVAYSGGHFLAALDQPMLRRTVLNAILWTAHVEVPANGVAVSLDRRAGDRAAAALAAAPPVDRRGPAGADAPAFHADAQRSGWHSRQPALTRVAVAASDFGLLWDRLR